LKDFVERSVFRRDGGERMGGGGNCGLWGKGRRIRGEVNSKSKDGRDGGSPYRFE